MPYAETHQWTTNNKLQWTIDDTDQWVSEIIEIILSIVGTLDLKPRDFYLVVKDRTYYIDLENKTFYSEIKEK